MLSVLSGLKEDELRAIWNQETHLSNSHRYRKCNLFGLCCSIS